MSTSKLQERTKARLRMLLGEYGLAENHRPDWLTNPETGYPLELDFYLPDFNVGIEVQGAQHSQFVPRFHRTLEGFEQQVKRDQLKKQLCRARGVYLYEVFTPNDIEHFIAALAGENRDLVKELHKKNNAIKALGYLAARLQTEHRKGRGANPAAIEGYARHIVHICEKYNVPIKSVRPDYTITKMELCFWGNSIVTITRNVNSKTLTYQAAILKVTGDVVHLRWMANGLKGVYVDGDFRLPGCEQIDPPDEPWAILPDTLPTVLKQRFGIMAQEDISDDR